MLGALIVPIGIIVMGALAIQSSYAARPSSGPDTRITARQLGWFMVVFGIIAVIVVVGHA